MSIKKFSLIIASFILVCIFLLKNNDTEVDATYDVNEDLDPPVIEKIVPNKCQQYIIGKPKISIDLNDLSGIDKNSIKLYVNYNDVTKDCDISENSVTYTPKSKFKRGNQIIQIEACDLSPNKNKLTHEWYFTVGTPIYSHYRGLLHAHTSNSDGKGSYEDAYYLAKYKANLDYFAITEHSNYFDNISKCNLDDGSSSDKWTSLINCSNKFTSNGEFVALAGFEMTYSHKDKNAIGHINIFNTDGFVSTDDKSIDLKTFYNLISKNDEIIGQFNHPNDEFGKFENFNYSSLGDSVVSLLEVGNGSNSNLDKTSKAYDMYQFALDKGWHVAPVCNQDNHTVNFGIANEYRTIILSTDLTKEALYDGLRNMRVYASEDKNLKIDYSINDSPLGSTLNKPSKLNFSICAIDNDLDDKIKEIQVISNKGEIIKQKSFNSNLGKLEFSTPCNNNTFYYVKVIQSPNKTSVTAPIWIKK
ncbi:MAG: CehA/McbA family metallohydrolase [Peptostreptococcaceae bacterium]